MRIAKRLLGFKSLVLIVNRESESWDPSLLDVPLRTCDLIDRGEDVRWGPCSTLSDSLRQTCHESSDKKITKGKNTIFTNILTEIYCGRDHWKYERPAVNKEFHVKILLEEWDTRGKSPVK